MSEKNSVNDVLDKYEKLNAKLSIRELSDEGYRSVLIEGNSTALNFLADLLRAVIEGKDCGLELSPNGPGNIFFSEDSGMGFYLHVTDAAGCKHEKAKKGD